MRNVKARPGLHGRRRRRHRVARSAANAVAATGPARRHISHENPRERGRQSTRRAMRCAGRSPATRALPRLTQSSPTARLQQRRRYNPATPAPRVRRSTSALSVRASSALRNMGAHQSRGQIVNALEVLKKSEVAPDDHDFWDDFWSTKTSAEEVRSHRHRLSPRSHSPPTPPHTDLHAHRPRGGPHPPSKVAPQPRHPVHPGGGAAVHVRAESHTSLFRPGPQLLPRPPGTTPPCAQPPPDNTANSPTHTHTRSASCRSSSRTPTTTW